MTTPADPRATTSDARPPGPREPAPSGPREPASPGHSAPGHRASPARPAGLPPTDWPDARRIARGVARPVEAVSRPLSEALGQVLAAPLEALTDLPAFDTSAMDGWAVAGPGPWRLAGELLAGQPSRTPLAPGRAVAIATGAPLPPGASAVLRREHGLADPGLPHGPAVLRALPEYSTPPAGQDIRPRGQECRAGERLLAPGALVTAPVLALAAAAGYDTVPVVPRPRVEVFVLGDELLREGLPRDGRVRDALGPLLAPWLRELGAEVADAPHGTRWLGDDAEALRQAIGRSTADLVITTGGTAAGPVDFVHPVLARLKASLLVDGVAVRPGHPMLLAVLPGGRPVVGLPGNPLAAVCGVLTLVAPLLSALGGRAEPERRTARLTDEVPAHPGDTRLVPVVFSGALRVRPLRFRGPAMLRGFAEAEGMAVIPPGSVPHTGEVEVVRVPAG